MKIIRAPYISQAGRWPTGCESVSAVMLLNYLGVDISVDDFIRDYLPLGSFETRAGETWGPDPRETFCGSPYDENGMGCYAPVIRGALEKVLKDYVNFNALRAVDETGTDMDTLLRRYIDRDMPVVYWACIDMRPPVRGPAWRLLGSGERFEWVSNEHCMRLVGYDEEGCWFNDPHEGRGLVRYPRNLTEDRHRAQRAMAVAVRRSEK